MKKLLLISLLINSFAFAQVGIGTTTPDASAMLDIRSSTNNQGVLIPRLTRIQILAISNPATGLLVYNTNNNRVCVNIGTPTTPSWKQLQYEDLAPAKQTFLYTGADQSFIVPAGVTSLTIQIWGAGGGGGYFGGGGSGAYVTGTLTVNQGDTLTLVVGKGGDQLSNIIGFGGAGAGGSGSTYNGGAGGGRSAIRFNGSDIITAGGGGGGAYYLGGGNNAHGGGGGATDANGSANFAGRAGTTTAGGSRGTMNSLGTNGSLSTGGNGGSSTYGGGGAGGGYYGGGGGSGYTTNGTGGGGGGASYISFPLFAGTNTTGTLGNVGITAVAGGTGTVNYLNSNNPIGNNIPTGQGGEYSGFTTSNGGNGLIVITY